MRLQPILVCVVVVTGCDSGKPAPPAREPATAVPETAVPDARPAQDLWAPTAPPESVPSVPPPSDETIRKLLDSLRKGHSQRNKTGPGLCLAKGVEKSCKTDTDCAIVDVILDECRTTVQIGVTATAKTGLEVRLVDPCAHKRCPACVVRWMYAEDCAHSGEAAVSCLKGRCTTRMNPR